VHRQSEEDMAGANNDLRNYVSKAKKVRKTLGGRPAADLTPQEIDRWLRSNTKTAATSNGYKAFFSLAYREGVRNGKVKTNPAHLARHRREPQGRLRFLSQEEYDILYAIISKRYPEHLAELVVSVHSGMRVTEQYTCDWSQIHLNHRAIDLTKTKNGYSRIVSLNADSIAAIESLRQAKQRPTDRVFPREVKKTKKGSKPNFDTRSWFAPCLAGAEISGYL
jgi:integrase